MKKIPALTIGALFLFNITTQMAFGDSGDNKKHDKGDHHSDHSNNEHGGNNGHENHSNHVFSQSHGQPSFSQHHVNTNHAVRVETPKHDTHISTPKPSFTRSNEHRDRSHSADHSSQSHVEITSRKSSGGHHNHFSVSSKRYNTFISSGWRTHRGWDRDRDGHFFYHHNRIFFSIINGFYYPYYLEGGTPVYLSYSSDDADTVASVQQALANAGYYNGGIDGEFGPNTSRSIAAYQNDHGLTPTGEINDALIDSLGLN